MHVAYDEDFIYMGFTGDDISGSEYWLNIYSSGGDDTLSDFTFSAVQWSSSLELYRIFGLTDVGTPTMEFYENDSSTWSVSGDSVDFEVFTSGSFLKWKLSKSHIPSVSRFYIVKTDDDEVVCTSEADVSLPTTELGFTPTLQLDSNLVIPPGLQ